MIISRKLLSFRLLVYLQEYIQQGCDISITTNALIFTLSFSPIHYCFRKVIAGNLVVRTYCRGFVELRMASFLAYQTVVLPSSLGFDLLHLEHLHFVQPIIVATLVTVASVGTSTATTSSIDRFAVAAQG